MFFFCISLNYLQLSWVALRTEQSDAARLNKTMEKLFKRWYDHIQPGHPRSLMFYYSLTPSLSWFIINSITLDFWKSDMWTKLIAMWTSKDHFRNIIIKWARKLRHCWYESQKAKTNQKQPLGKLKEQLTPGCECVFSWYTKMDCKPPAKQSNQSQQCQYAILPVSSV